MAKEPEDFGENLYVVKVPKSVCEQGEVVLYADKYEIDSTGCLYFSYKDDERDEYFTIAFNTNEWKSVYQGHTKHEYPVCVKRWHGIGGIRVEQVNKPVSVKEVVITRQVAVEVEKSVAEMTDEELEKATSPESAA